MNEKFPEGKPEKIPSAETLVLPPNLAVLANNVERAAGALRMIVDRETPNGASSVTELDGINNSIRILDEMYQEIIKGPLTQTQQREISDSLRNVQIACTSYLSQEQYETVFGTDKLF